MSLTPAAAVQRVLKNPSDVAAYDVAIAGGPAAVPAIVKILAAGRAVPQMGSLLSMLSLPDPVATLGPLLAHEESDESGVATAAMSALARVDDPRVLGMILAQLARPGMQSYAAEALGDHGDPAALDALRAIVTAVVGKKGKALPKKRTESRDRELRGVVEAVIAMAKLGDQEFAPLVIELATLVDRKDPYAGSDLRVSATIALSYLAAPGVAGAIRKTLSDPNDEVVAEGLRNSLYLGRVKEAEGIMEVIRAGGEQAGIATWYLEAWSGEHPTGDRDEQLTATVLDKWWARAKSKFSAGVCYRLGKPIDLGTLVAKLPKDPLHCRDELRIHTGAPCFHDGLFGDPVSKTERTRVAKWWKAHAAELPTGKLYRWGRTFKANAVD